MSAQEKARERRMRKAVKLYHFEDMTVAEIAEEMGYSEKTIHRYLNDEKAESYHRIFTDEERYELQRKIEEEVDTNLSISEKVFKNIAAKKSADSQDRIRAAKELRNNVKDKVGILQELGVLDKEAEKHEVEHSGVPPVQIITGESEASGEPDVTTGEDDV